MLNTEEMFASQTPKGRDRGLGISCVISFVMSFESEFIFLSLIVVLLF